MSIGIAATGRDGYSATEIGAKKRWFGMDVEKCLSERFGGPPQKPPGWLSPVTGDG